MPPRRSKASASGAAGGTPTAKAGARIAPIRPATIPPQPKVEKPIDVEGLEEWEEITRRKWRGLGLTDPIKRVEVC